MVLENLLRQFQMRLGESFNRFLKIFEPQNIHRRETLSRFLMRKDWYNKDDDKVLTAAFIPLKDKNEVSVYRTHNLKELQILSIWCQSTN